MADYNLHTQLDALRYHVVPFLHTISNTLGPAAPLNDTLIQTLTISPLTMDPAGLGAWDEQCINEGRMRADESQDKITNFTEYRGRIFNPCLVKLCLLGMDWTLRYNWALGGQVYNRVFICKYVPQNLVEQGSKLLCIAIFELRIQAFSLSSLKVNYF